MKSLDILILLAGIAQIVLAAASFFIPGILKWKTQLDKVDKLVRQVFWTYAGYILSINFLIGLLSVMAFEDISNGSFLAIVLTGFITAYWLVRVLVQFLYFDTSSVLKNLGMRMGEIVLTTLFITLTCIYGYVFYINLTS